MDIHSKDSFPSFMLSNFHAHKFVLDGVKCASMEGLLQGLKVKNPEIQKEYCKLVGFEAKKRGSRRTWFWKKHQTLWWQGKPMKRRSKAYQKFIDRAYNALGLNSNFQKALLYTGNKALTHSIGGQKMKDTILTEREFCSRLMKLRARLRNLLDE